MQLHLGIGLESGESPLQVASVALTRRELASQNIEVDISDRGVGCDFAFFLQRSSSQRWLGLASPLT